MDNKIKLCWAVKIITAMLMPILFTSIAVTYTLSAVGIDSSQYPSIINVNNEDMFHLGVFIILWMGIELYELKKRYDEYIFAEGDPLK